MKTSVSTAALMILFFQFWYNKLLGKIHFFHIWLVNFFLYMVKCTEKQTMEILPMYCRLADFDCRNRPMQLEATDNKASLGDIVTTVIRAS